MSVMGLGLGVWVGIAAAWTAPPATIPLEPPTSIPACEQRAPGHLEMFLDDQRIAVRSGLRRVVKPPARHPRPVITSEHPWEHNLSLYGTVLYDADLQRYRAWYSAFNSGGSGKERFLVAYAESNDGRRFVKPTLGLFEFDGNGANNIVLQASGYGSMYSPSVILDPTDPDPSRRYKMALWDHLGHGGSYGGRTGLALAFSPDGVHWRRAANGPALVAARQEQSISDVIDLMHDPRTGRYVIYGKGWADPFPHHRQIIRSESRDFITWSTPEVVIRHACTTTDPQSYGMTVFAYEGLYIGLLRSYKQPGNETIDIQLAVSRDNHSWSRVGEQATFVPLGPDGSFDDGMLFTSRPVIWPDRIELYYSGWDGPHDSRQRRSVIGLATLHIGRFVALTPEAGYGILQTTPLQLTHRQLIVNANAERGALRVALLGPDGDALPGHAMQDFDVLTTDGTALVAGWGGSTDLTALAGQKVSLAFELRGAAELYGYQWRTAVAEP